MKIGILSFRIDGLDGVSLEIEHWKDILERMGHEVVLIGGQIEEALGGVVLESLSFQTKRATEIQEKLIDKNFKDTEDLKREIFSYAKELIPEVKDTILSLNLDFLMIANVFSLPVHPALTVALTEIFKDIEKPKLILKHHDFWWERQRYQRKEWIDFFNEYFPPDGLKAKHLVINSLAQKEFLKRKGILAFLFPDTFDFENKKLILADEFSKKWREFFNISQNDIVFLQATRAIPRKRLEISVELINRLKIPWSVLVFTGKEGDEGYGYLDGVKQLASQTEANIKFIGEFVDDKRRITPREKVFNIWDCYKNADFILYPTRYEGFGNQFLEAVYFKKPIILTPYPVYLSDIKPLGFKVLEINFPFTESDIKKTKEFIFADKKFLRKITEKNFKIAKKHFSYRAAMRRFKKILK